MAEKHETDGATQTPVEGTSTAPQRQGEVHPSTLEKASGAGGSDQVQKKVDAEEEKGYHGTVPEDDTDYTVAGQLEATAKEGKK